jgi:hypothetical protein
MTKEASIAERMFHLTKGQPVIPSNPRYFTYEIDVSLSATLDLSNFETLKSLGVDVARYGALSYVERPHEYPSTQQISEIAHFLEFDGLVVPSARTKASNLIMFTKRVDPGSLIVVGTPELANKK